MEIKGLEGIELDVQLTKDGELVVIHDERVDRTTEGIGFVRDYTLDQLKKLHIYVDDRPSQRILTMAEVLDLTERRVKEGMKLNIELKTGSYPYPEKPTGGRLDLEELERQGITDVILNEPEVYAG